MKLEIDIDEDYYKIICKRVEKNKPYHSPYEYEVIANGKPLEQEPIKLTNPEMINFLVNQFDISRTSAKEMLHGMMRVKAYDNFKKQFSGNKMIN